MPSRSRSRWNPGVTVLATLIIVPSACEPASPPPAEVDVLDSAGVALVRNGPDGRRLELAVERDFSLGGEETETGSFYRVSRYTVAADGEGRIAVLDDDHHRVLVFDADGRHLRTLGGEGEGPGEISWPTSVSAAADGRIFVFDIAKRGLVAWRADGEPMEGPRLPPGFFGGQLAVDGEAYLFAVDRAEPFEAQLVRFVPGADTAAVVRVPRPDTKPIRLESCGMGFSGMPPLFAPGLRWAVGGGLVAVATGADYVVDLYRDGRLVRSVRRSVEPRAATRELAVADVGDAMRVMTEGGERVCEASEVAEQRGWRETIPAVGTLAVAPDGTLWVERYRVGEEPSVIDLFDAEGRYLGTFEDAPRPVGFLPDGRMLWAETDEYDVQRLVVGRAEWRVSDGAER